MKPKQFPEIILFLNDNPLPGIYTKGVVSGKELRLRSALQEVKELHVLAPKGTWVGDKDNQKIGFLEKKIHVHHFPTCPYYFRAIPLFLWGLYFARNIKPDLIETESPIISGPAGIILGKLSKKPVVVEVRASYYELIRHKVHWLPFALKKILLDFVYIQTLRRASGVIANSDYYRRQLDEIGVRSIRINPGIQLQSIKVQPKITKKKSAIVGFLGRLEPEKGLEILIEAMGLLVTRKESIPNLKLLIAGVGSQRERLESLVKNNPFLHSRVQFLGFQTPQQFFPKINLFVNPNIVRHPLEMVNVEAAFYGKPVICFGDDQIPETVIDGKTGVKVCTLLATDLAKAIIELINDSRRYKQFCTLAPGHSQNYSFEVQVKKLQSFYKKLQNSLLIS